MTLAVEAPAIPIGHLQRTLQMRERVAEACRLVSTGRAIRGVHIVAQGRLTPEEQRRYEDYATRLHVKLSVDSHGVISVRPCALEDA